MIFGIIKLVLQRNKKNLSVLSSLLLSFNLLGVINQNLILVHFLLEIYIQLEQKCQSELVEDIKKDTFRYFLCQHKLSSMLQFSIN